jgi:hypothetical protein
VKGRKLKWGRAFKSITSGFIVVYIDSFQLQITVSMVTASGVDTMFITDDLPKLRHKKAVFNHVRPPLERPPFTMKSTPLLVLTTQHFRSFKGLCNPSTALGLVFFRVRKLKLGVSQANSC